MKLQRKSPLHVPFPSFTFVVVFFCSAVWQFFLPPMLHSALRSQAPRTIRHLLLVLSVFSAQLARTPDTAQRPRHKRPVLATPAPSTRMHLFCGSTLRGVDE